MSPIDTVMTPASECKVFSKDVSMHWYPGDAQVGDTCYCGECVKSE